VSFENKNELANISNFLLLSLLQKHYITEEGQSGGSFPRSIYRVYDNQFQRFFTPNSSQKFKIAKSIFEVISTSFESPTKEKVWLIVSNIITSITLKQFNFDFQILDNFIRKIGNNIHFFHLSFQEWLTSEENINFSVDIERGHELNALYIFKQIENGNYEDDIVNLVMHVDLSLSKFLQHRFLNMPKFALLKMERNKEEYPLLRLVKRLDSFDATDLFRRY
jgi:hypothetical protein